MEPSVLIVGAGPVGLTAALSLTQQGVSCRIIDRLPHRINQSRAAVVHARTAELFERMGVVQPFLDNSIRVHAVNVLDTHGKVLLRVALEDLPTRFNCFLGIGQDQTERLLAEELEKLGVSIERSVTLTSLTQTFRSVKARLEYADGTQEDAHCEYLIGCDGGKSTVRHRLGLHLEGETLDVHWATADVKMEWHHAVPENEAIALPSPDGVGFVMPLPGGRWRVIVDMGNKPPANPEALSLEEVQEACDRVGIHARIFDPVWISPFGVNTRLAPMMQVGRVFLAGDASHVHSPVGGQGMNTGIQDAVNLAWKLALYIKGKGTQTLLESYDQERHANAEHLLSFVGPATKMVDLHNPVAVGMRNMVLSAASHLGATKKAARRASEIDIHYRHSAIVYEHRQGTAEWLSLQNPHPGLVDCWDFNSGPHAGERAPDARGLVKDDAEPRRLFEVWTGDHAHQLLVFTGIAPKPERLAELAAIASEIEFSTDGLIRAHVIRPKNVELPGAWIDTEGDAHNAYGARFESLYLVRPDCYIGFRTQPAEIGPLRDYLKRIFVGV